MIAQRPAVARARRLGRVPSLHYPSVRGGSGLGDSLYVQGVARYFIQKLGHQTVQVASDWPDVFRPLGNNVEVIPFCRDRSTHVAHYTSRKAIANTTQFDDCCINVGIKEPVEFKLDWTITDAGIVDHVRDMARGRPIVIVQLPRNPMNRTDNFAKDLMPDAAALQRVVDAVRDRALIVQVGKGNPLFRLQGVDVDLANATTVATMFDVVSVADAALTYVSFMVPLAESLGKPLLAVWSRRGLHAGQAFIRQITPKKIFQYPSSRFVMDDAGPEEQRTATHALLDAL